MYFKRSSIGRGGQSGRGGPLLQSTGQPLQKLVWNRKWEGGSQSGRGGPVLHSFALFSLYFMNILWFPINSRKVGGGVPKWEGGSTFRIFLDGWRNGSSEMKWEPPPLIAELTVRIPR